MEFISENLVYIGGVVCTIAVGAATYSLLSEPDAMTLPIDLENQSVVCKDGSRRSPLIEDPYSKEYLIDGVETQYEAFQRGMRISGDGPCLGERRGPDKEYVWITYKQVFERARHFGSGLLHLGMEPGSFFGIFSKNRIEWALSEQACNDYSLVTVPLFDTWGAEVCAYILNLTELSTMFCGSEEKVKILLSIAESVSHLRTIIVSSLTDDDLKQEAKSKNINLYTFQEIEILGENNPHQLVLPKPDDLVTICFTSGTTGRPKGAKITHKGIVYNGSAISYPDVYMNPKLSKEDCHFSFLPMAHMYERTVQFMVYVKGARIGFYQGDVKLLLEDMQELKPTMFTAVPRLLNRLHDKVKAGVQGSRLKKYLLELALSKKEAEYKRGIIRKNSIWDKLVLRKIQAILGGNVRIVTVGSAPLSSEVMRFCRAAFGCTIVEGFGQTEATCGITFQVSGDHGVGHVGAPLTCCFVRVVDVPDMGYFASEGKGEVCGKGPCVFQGYYKNPEQTAEALDEDGWLHTGDIGMWLPNGTLRIIDRKKNIYKLSQGEYIAPEKVENIYMSSPFVAQTFVHGDSVQSRSMAIVVPDPEVLIPWASRKCITGNMEELCQNEQVKTAILDDMLRYGKEGMLNSLEQVKDIHLRAEMFSIENGLLTPTFKNKRQDLKRFFAKEFESLYAKMINT